MDHVLPWLTLKNVKGIGNLLFKRLVDRFGTPEAVLSASLQDLARVPGLSENLARAILHQKSPQRCRRELAEAAARGYGLITQIDPGYPALLLEIHDPPPFLYVYGHLEAEAASVAVVGSRRATSYGLTTTHRLCEGMAAHGMTVVSGMARGIDTAAHKGTLAGGGRTVAVLGTGLNHIYPAENLKLFHQIAENGAVISELPLNAGPEAHHFPARNRIISGICLGTVVVEAARRSGSLITARLAAEQGREVFAVPGSVQAATSQGTHTLIQQGAKLVQHVSDILEELQPFVQVKPAADSPSPVEPRQGLPALRGEERLVFDALEPYALHIDELARKLNLEVGRLAGILIQLECKGIVFQEPGNYYIRNRNFD